MSASAQQLMLDTLGAWLRGVEHPLDLEHTRDVAFRALVRRNRLEALFNILIAGDSSADTSGWVDTCSAAYVQGLAAGYRQLEIGVGIMAQLEQAGIASFACRGPFAGVALYGDVGVRRFDDLDLYIRKSDAAAAWTLFREAGYLLYNEDMPRGFYLRNHLHWMFVHETRQNVIDLHWAVDHPYCLSGIAYDELFERRVECRHESHSWLQPGANDLLLLHAAHLLKHLPDAVACARAEDVAGPLLERGELKHWLDIACLLVRHGDALEVEDLFQTARAWQVEEALYAALQGVDRLFPGLVPEALQPGLAALAPRVEAAPPLPERAPRLLEAISRHGEFRAERAGDAWRFLWPPEQHFDPGPARPLRRAGHALGAGSRLAFALGDGMACAGIAAARKFRRRRIGGDSSAQHVQIKERPHA